MKLPCEMVRDLLPLYHDGVCSQVSSTLVGEHLRGCPDCSGALQIIEAELEVPRLEADAAKPMKSIKSRWKRKTWTLGILIGVAAFVLCFSLWVGLTQNCFVPVAAEEYQVENVWRFSNGMYYLEYSLPYKGLSYSADICRTDDGAIHVRHYRPRLVRKDTQNRTVRGFLIDPVNNIMHSDSGEEVALTAFYLGCPDMETAVLLWSADMDIPLAGEETEKEHLYQFVFR